MVRAKSLLALSVLIVAAVGSAVAQSLEKRHQIELRIGVWNQVTNDRTEIGGGTVATTVSSSGFLGGLAYGHWVQEYLALRISVGAMAASVETEIGGPGVSTRTAVVSPMLFGMKYYFPRSTYGSSTRPFVGAGIGAFIGSQTATEISATVSVESRNETAMGGELNLGLDFILGRLVMASVAVGYDVMTDFNEPIGGSDNYSGPQLTLGLSLLLGGGTSQR
jgi:outer membrane protein W